MNYRIRTTKLLEWMVKKVKVVIKIFECRHLPLLYTVMYFEDSTMT